MAGRPQRVFGENLPEGVAPDASRAAILDAAATCFMERGYEATSIDDVARRLGATKGRIYHHFPSKADLFADVFRAGMEMNYAAVEPCLADDGPVLERWKRMATVHTTQMIRTKAFQRVTWEGVEMHLRGSTTPEQREVFTRLVKYRADYGDLFRKTIAQARDEGVMRFDSLSIANQLMFITLNSPIFWYTPRIDETDEDTVRIIRQIVACAQRGLGAMED